MKRFQRLECQFRPGIPADLNVHQHHVWVRYVLHTSMDVERAAIPKRAPAVRYYSGSDGVGATRFPVYIDEMAQNITKYTIENIRYQR